MISLSLLLQELTTAWDHEKLSFLFLAGNLLPFSSLDCMRPGRGMKACFSLPLLCDSMSLCKSPLFRSPQTPVYEPNAVDVKSELRMDFTFLIG